MMTAAVSALPDDVGARAIELTRTFDDFTTLWKMKASQCAPFGSVPSQCAGHGLNNCLKLFDCAGVPSSGQKDSHASSNCFRL